MRRRGLRVQNVQEGHRGGGQPDVLPPDQGEVPFHLQVRHWKRPQDAVLHLQHDGIAGDHGNPESRHNRLLDPFTALQNQGMPLQGVVGPERAFDDLPGRRPRLPQDPGLADEVGQGDGRLGYQPMLRRHRPGYRGSRAAPGAGPAGG